MVSCTSVVDDLVGLLLEELERWESLHLDLLDLVGGGVHLGDDDVRGVLEVLGQLVPLGLQGLAVA